MRRVFAAAALAALGFACSSPSGPKPAELPHIEQSATVRALWTARVGDGERFVFTPALAEGAVFTAARDGTVMRLDRASGRTVWSVSGTTVHPLLSSSPGETTIWSKRNHFRS